MKISDESVDLIYLDPPFNSSATYNVLFAEPNGSRSSAQITAFDDTWHWGEEPEATYTDIVTGGPRKSSQLIEAMRLFLGKNDMMAYLVMMVARLVEIHRVLRKTGSLYLHCYPTASHYLKIVMDAIFGHVCFRNEIIWKRTTAHSDARRFGANADIIFFYSKSDSYVFNSIFQPYNADYVSRYRHVDPDGRRSADDNLTAKGLTGGGYMNTNIRGFDHFGGVLVLLWNNLTQKGISISPAVGY